MGGTFAGPDPPSEFGGGDGPEQGVLGFPDIDFDFVLFFNSALAVLQGQQIAGAGLDLLAYSSLCHDL